MKKRFLCLMLSGAIAAALAMTGCGAKDDTKKDVSVSTEESSMVEENKDSASVVSAEEVEENGDVSTLSVTTDETITVGYLAQNESDTFCVIMGNAIVDECAKIGPNIIVEKSDAQSIAANQVTQAEDMITRGVDVVIISAVDQDASAPAVDKLTEKGIPVVILNTLVSNYEKGVSYVGVDDREAGEVALSIVANALGEKGGVVNIIQGLLGHPANENRFNGILEDIANYPNLTIGSAQAADWDRNKAMNVASDWMAGDSPFDAVIALNDEMAISAANAFTAAGKDIPVVGIDALDEALELVKAGKMAGTVFQDGVGQGKAAADVAVMAALGQKVAKNYIIPFEPVTADNVDDYMGRVG